MSTSDPLPRAASPRTAPAVTPALQSFEHAAQVRCTLQLTPPDGLAASFGPELLQGLDGPEPVVWVQGCDDAIGMFIRALETSCGTELSATIARELSLQPAPGRPLASRDVRRALEAVETSRQAIAGVDYFTLLQHSARVDSPGFRNAVKAAGFDPACLSPERRTQLDAALEQRLAQASAIGETPVSPETAKKWLHDELLLLTRYIL